MAVLSSASLPRPAVRSGAGSLKIGLIPAEPARNRRSCLEGSRSSTRQHGSTVSRRLPVYFVRKPPG
jgi:hypothetical protein